MPWPLVADLPSQLDQDPGPALIWLGRYGRRSDLERESEKLSRHPYWGPLLALQLAWALRLCGDAIASDRWILVAHRLDPALGLIPDHWGLWTDDSSSGCSPLAEQEQRQAHELVERLRRLRWQQPALPLTPLPDWRSDWQDEQLDDFALLLAGTKEVNKFALFQTLIATVGEQEIADAPEAALRWWAFLAEAFPDWGYPRLKAADLALASGAFQACEHWLAAPSADLQSNPWLFDLSARLALARGDLAAALDRWGQAMAQSLSSESSDEELAELFRQRRREARRTQGPNCFRALCASGDSLAAAELLGSLIQQDPQWQPFRDLEREQIRDREREQAEVVAEASTPVVPPAPVASFRQVADPITAELSGGALGANNFATFLERSAARINLPLPIATEALPLEAFATTLAKAEARISLLY